MDCATIQENLVAYGYGELTLDEVLKIHQHLSHCEKCAAEEIEFRRATRCLSRVQPVQLSDDFSANLARKLVPMRQPPLATRHGFHRLVYAVAAVLLLALGFELIPRIFPGAEVNPGKLTAYSSGQAIFDSQKAEISSRWKKTFLEKYREKAVF